MEGRKTTKREAPISYRPPVRLREEFRARVEQSGLSACGYITQAVFGMDAPRRPRRPAVEQQTLVLLLAQAARLTDALQEISRNGGDAREHTIALEHALDEMVEIRTAIFQALGLRT